MKSGERGWTVLTEWGCVAPAALFWEIGFPALTGWANVFRAIRHWGELRPMLCQES
jgi:hypothetical protein